MYSITIRFYEELNFFLPYCQKKKDIEISFQGKRSVKDLIESLGIPHVEVDLILVNSESVDFQYLVKDGDLISVYPVFEKFDIRNITKLRSTPLRRVSFVLDVHLAKLARKLRLLGFDVDYSSHRDDEELAVISQKENRILLTRDKQLLMRRIIERGLYVRNQDPEEQVVEIIKRLDLKNECKPFTRCMKCNGIIKFFDYKKHENIIKETIPSGVKSWCNEYYQCETCNHIYWKGSHYDKLMKKIGLYLS